MKREILFRGKRVDNNEWVYGSLIVYSVTKDGKTKKYDIKLQDAYNTNLDSYRVISETVSQFTGLTDKNGVKIFEGDIIKYYQPYSKKWETHIVLWDNNFSCFGLFEKDNIWCKECDWMKIEKLEITGNIHDA